jgi:hypothetical protein
MDQPVVPFEFLSKGPGKPSAFYERIFGWTVTHRPELNYRIVETGAARLRFRRTASAVKIASAVQIKGKVTACACVKGSP